MYDPFMPTKEGWPDPYHLSQLEGEISPDLTEALADYRIALERAADRNRHRQPAASNGRDRVAETLEALTPLLKKYRAEAEAWCEKMPNGRTVVGHLAHFLDSKGS